MWPLIKQQKLLLHFCTKVSSLSLGPQPGSWVIEVLASPVVWFRKCARSLASNLWTTSYHPQTNGLVKRSYQTNMCMIGKLGEDKKANWPSHLVEIVHTYNATCSTVTRYSPHYLMFRRRPRLLVIFFFPTVGTSEVPMREASAKHVDKYVASIWDRLRTAYGRHKPNQQQKHADKNGTMTER